VGEKIKGLFSFWFMQIKQNPVKFSLGGSPGQEAPGWLLTPSTPHRALESALGVKQFWGEPFRPATCVSGNVGIRGALKLLYFKPPCLVWIPFKLGSQLKG